MAKKKKKRRKSGKGPGYERTFCKDFSLWWTNGIRDDIFWRTAGSGARATSRFKQGLRTADNYGDLKAEHKVGKPFTRNFVVSMKRGYTGKKGKKGVKYIELLNIIDNPDALKTRPLLVEWWEEIEETRVSARRKFSLLVFKRDRKEEVICMAPSTLVYIEKNCSCKYNGPFIVVSSGNTQLVAMKLANFYRWCNPMALGKKTSKRKIKRRVLAKRRIKCTL